MGGALTVAVPGFQYTRLMHKPVLGMSFSMPGKKDLDKKLILGAVLFGMGWGLAGICPGPSLVALNALDGRVVLFVVALLAGLLFHDKVLSS